MSLHRHILSLGRGGIEPPTYCLSDSRSNQLSYHPIWLLCFISSVKFNSVLSNEIFCFFTTVKPSQILFVVLFVENVVSTHTKMAFYKINIILQSLSLVSPMFLEERQTFLTPFLVREVNIVLFGTCCTTKRNILFVASTHRAWYRSRTHLSWLQVKPSTAKTTRHKLTHFTKYYVARNRAPQLQS